MTYLFFNISGGEIFIILLVVFIIFGPDKIPEIARWLGKGVGEIKKATSEIREEINRETKDIRDTANKIRDDIKKETDGLKLKDTMKGSAGTDVKNPGSDQIGTGPIKTGDQQDVGNKPGSSQKAEGY